jgi:hypothetical protein
MYGPQFDSAELLVMKVKKKGKAIAVTGDGGLSGY